MTAHFYLGTHMPHWLTTAGVPLFVSHRRLAGRRTLPRVGRAGWALDSGGFTELSMYGEWRTTPEEYVAAVRRYDREVGELDWAAPQDWMCEPFILAKTGLTVAEHQRRTIDNFQRLTDLWWDAEDAATGMRLWGDPTYRSDRECNLCPFMPVLQGWAADDYRRHADAYYAAGIRLEDYPLVGLGSVCRRQYTTQIDRLIREFTPWLELHGFGCKTAGLSRYGHRLGSADSLAWSYAGRREPAGCDPSHRNEANCLRYALAWRERVLDAMTAPEQPELFDSTTVTTRRTV